MSLRRPAVPLVVTAAVLLALSACGSDSLSGPASGGAATDTGTAGPAPTVTKNPTLAAKVPAKAAKAGKLVSGIDPTYPPLEVLAADGKTVEGLDVDMLKAVATTLGVEIEFQPSAFDAILLGVDSGKFDIAASSFTINSERKKSVNMVSYFRAGTLWAVKAGNPTKLDRNDPCGRNVGVQKGTTQFDELTRLSKTCTTMGKPAINVIVDEQQVNVTAALTSGKVDAMSADSPVVIHAVAQTHGEIEKLGDSYDTAPYGIVVPKGEVEFARAIVEALKELKANGAYDHILAKWNLQDGGIADFAVNP